MPHFAGPGAREPGRARGARHSSGDRGHLGHRSRPATAAREGARKEETEREAVARFRHVDVYRVDREWQRYAGTPQRDLLREMRFNLLDRHATSLGRALEIGPGPGRFMRHIGTSHAERVGLDLSLEMLRSLRTRWAEFGQGDPLPSLITANGMLPPFREGTFQEVVVLGNVLGFSGEDIEPALRSFRRLLAPSGSLVLEFSAGPGTRSCYLGRLPASSLPRLFESPVRLLVARVAREGYEMLRVRRTSAGAHRRRSLEHVEVSLEQSGLRVLEKLAVAPALGGDPSRLRGPFSPRAWEHLVAMETELGHRPEAFPGAAAVLVVAQDLRPVAEQIPTNGP